MRSLRISVLLSCIFIFGACGATVARQHGTMPARQHGAIGTAVIKHPRPLGFWENGSAVVQVIHTDDDLGSGAVVDNRGLILTSNHVVRRIKDEATGELSGTGLYQVCVVSPSEKTCYEAFVVATNERRDLALLRVDHKFARAIKFTPDKFAPEGELRPGDELYMWGNYLSYLPPSPFFGRYLGLVGPPYFTQESEVGLPVLAIDNSTSPGASGGPVFDSLGRCVGKTFGGVKSSTGNGRSVGLAIPAKFIKEFIKENNPFTKK